MAAHSFQVCFSRRKSSALSDLGQILAGKSECAAARHRLHFSSAMTDPGPARRYRFGVFEADASTGELRRRGVRVRLNAQPFQVLVLLLDRPGRLLTREEISRELWPDGTFVEEEHGVHSAINRIREALGDAAAAPRFVETLARRGYRFIAPVEIVGAGTDAPLGGQADASGGESVLPAAAAPPFSSQDEIPEGTEAQRSRFLASPEQLPKLSRPVTRTFFVLFQLMYLGFYIGALVNLGEIQDLLSPLHHATVIFFGIIVTAALLIPVRAFVMTAAVLHAPGFRGKYLHLWLFLLPFDAMWSLAPFLLLHHINFGLALACTALLSGSPFAQRSLVPMGAASAPPEGSRPARRGSSR